jgi:MINDY deubiquitinase
MQIERRAIPPESNVVPAPLHGYANEDLYQRHPHPSHMTTLYLPDLADLQLTRLNMVLRKSSQSTDSLPYPTSPAQFKAAADPSINPHSHLDVDTSDLPPIPESKRRDMEEVDNSPYHDYGNPWSQETSTLQPLPPPLHAGRTPETAADRYMRQDLPEALRIGHSDQVTPRSSLESLRSKGFWEVDEAEDRQADSMTDQRGNKFEAKEEDADNFLPKVPIPEPIASAGTGIRRKPVALAATDIPVLDRPSLPAPQDFASNNPFRRANSSERAQQQEPLSSSNAWSEIPRERTGSRSPKGKGREALQTPALDTSSGFIVVNTSLENKSQTSLQSDFNSGLEASQQRYQPDEDLLLSSPNADLPPPHPSAPPPPIPTIQSPFSTQPPLIPVSSQTDQDSNPWFLENSNARSPALSIDRISEARPSQYNDSLLDCGQETGVISFKDESSALPNAQELDSSAGVDLLESQLIDADIGLPLPLRNKAQNIYQQPGRGVTFSLDDNEYFPAPERTPPVKPPRPNISANSNRDDDYSLPEGPPPTKPPRPNVSAQDGDYFVPPEGPPPTKPPRPAVVSRLEPDEKLARMIEQRNETYQIKHFNWFDHRAGRLRTSSMLTQNKNGPCPLLALVNALILGVKEDSQAALDDALRSREQVTLGLIIETLIDELISGSYEDLPDVDELNRFLLMLHTGMNANPRFVGPSTPTPNLIDARISMLHVPQLTTKEQPGGFEPTQDMRLYGAFSVPLVHGWLPSKKDPATAAFKRSAQTYEDAQALQFGEEELEYKLSCGGLSEDEERVWQDITSIKNFLRQFPTQLTPYGLEVIRDWLLPGQFAIMFRNDHFSTIYKHPESGKLFTLITDAGYADRDEIVWESLSNHNGASEFYSGDFRPVGGTGLESSIPGSYPSAPASALSGPRQSSNKPLSAPTVLSHVSPQERQEQHDADFAMALQLQEEEERRANQNRRRPGPNRNTEGNIPIRLRSRQDAPRQDVPQQEVRPAIPPRTVRTSNPGVNRPADNEMDDAPPAYEEATRSKPYIPPVGSQHHPGADPSPRNSTTQLTATTSGTSSSSWQDQPTTPSPGPRRLTHPRRMSAYGENSSRYVPGSYISGSLTPSSPAVGRSTAQGYGVGAGGASGRSRGNPGQDRDCIVM